MRYYYDLPKQYTLLSGKTHICDHPAYDRCTLYLLDGKGLAVIQQRFNPIDKSTIWTEIDPWLIDEIFFNKRFKQYFDKYAGPPNIDIYPTVTVRQIMWGVRLKPLPKEPWETVFDRKPS